MTRSVAALVAVTLMMLAAGGMGAANIQTQSDDGLIAKWHFDEGSGNSLNDSSGNGNDGVIYGATWTAGKFGSALNFDGSDDYINIPTTPDLNPSDGSWTVEAWINIPTLPPSDYTYPVMAKHDGDMDNGYTLHVSGTTRTVKYMVDHYKGPVYKANSIISINTWYHVAGVLDRTTNTLKIFVNGSQMDSTSISGLGTINPSNPLWIGRYNRESRSRYEYFNGTIDEVRIYNRALTADEIKEHYGEIPTSDGFDYPVGSPYVTQANDGDGWYNAQDFRVNNHLGEDWNGEGGGDTDCGEPVYAVSKGTIVYATDAGSGWGNVTIVRHELPDGTQVESLYGHLQSMNKTSGTVERREPIGTIGKDGWPHCHLHFEIRFSNCSSWGSPGHGYSTDATGWTDPSDFIDLHRPPDFPADWAHSDLITIQENSGSDLTNYQIPIELNALNFDFSEAQLDGADIRFTELDGGLMSYWIEDWNSTGESAKVWVKVPSIPTNGIAAIRMYYGNSVATSKSNGSAVFEFFDDFSTNTLENYDLECDSRVTCGFDWDNINEQLIVSCLSGGCSDYWGGLYPKNLNLTNLIASCDFKVVKQYDSDTRFRIIARYQNRSKGYMVMYSTKNYVSPFIGRYSDEGSFVITSPDPDANGKLWDWTYRPSSAEYINTNTWYNMKFAVWNDNLRLFLNNIEKHSCKDDNVTIGGRVGFLFDENKGRIDNIIVRQYTSPEPTVTTTINTSSTSPQDRTLLQVEGQPEVYWLQNDRLYWVTDWDVISQMSGVPGWNSVNTLPASEFDPADYEQGPRFITTGAESDGLLIREQGYPEVYLIQGGEMHHFTSPEALLWNGYNFDDVINVSAAISEMFSPGSDISITQAIIDKYYHQGGEGTFGLSLGTGEKFGDEDSAGVNCSYVNFQNGAIECFTSGYLEGNAYAIVNPFFNKWADMGYGKSVLGYPVSDMSEVEYSSFNTPFKYQNFMNGTERGALEYNLNSGDVFEIHGAIFAKWEEKGFAGGVLGLVTGDEKEAAKSRQGTTGKYSKFENGTIHWISDNNADHPNKGESFVTYGDLDAIYTSWGGTDGNLGFPTMDQIERDGQSYCEFEGGYIRWNDLTENYEKHLVDVDIISPENLDVFEPSETIHLRGQILGGVFPYEYQWLVYEVGQSEDSGKKYSGISEASLLDVIDTSIDNTGKYKIKFLVVDSNGYSFEKQMQIYIIPTREVYDTTFRPKVHGYQFNNKVVNGYPWTMFRNTFGKNQVEFKDGSRKEKPNHFYKNHYIYLSKKSSGSCFGMSASSLALYSQDYEGWDLAGTAKIESWIPPKPKSGIFNPGEYRLLDEADIFSIYNLVAVLDYNNNRKYDPAPRLWTWDSSEPRPWDVNEESVFPLFMNTPRDWVNYYHGLQKTAGCKADMSSYESVNKVYKELKFRMDSSDWKHDSMVVGMIWDNDPSSVEDLVGHAVVPYKITENEESKIGTIFIYDSNSPKSQESPSSLGPRIEINLEDMKAEYISINAKGSETKIELTTLQAVSFDSIQSKPELPENVRDVTSNGHLGFTDSSGQHLGYHEGEFKDEIPGGNLIIPFGQTENDQFLEAYYLPNVYLKQELYGVQKGIATVSMYTPNGLIVAEVSVSPTSVDELSVPFNGSSIEFISGNGTSSLSLMLDEETSDFAQVARVSFSGIESDGAIYLSNIDGTIIVQNRGLPRTCNLYLEQIGISPNSDDSIKNIVIEENSTVLITPLNWNDISNSRVTIDHDLENDGTIDYTEALQLTDTTPPSTVMDIQSIVGSSWINWSWTNPYNTDFSHAVVYVDGEFKINTSDASYNLTGLHLEMEHTISLLTEDINGNMNLNWINDTSATKREIKLEDIDFTINRTQIFTGDAVEFNASSIYDPDGIILNYFWHFGDNTTNSTATGICVNHTYTEAGFYNVTFLVMDEDWDEENIITKQIIVKELVTSFPSSISNLHPTPSTTCLNWTWTNPPDPDFNHTELYLNGIFLTKIPGPQNYYNITGLLPDTSYELSTRTVDTSGNINLTWVNDTASTLPASGTTLNLYTGWNLISLPLMSEDTSITSLLSPINGNYSIVWEYNASDIADNWKKYDPSAPFGNDLTNMEAGKGYWIMMTFNDTLFVTGDVPGSTDIILKAGWNLIGHNSLVGQPIENALASVSGNYSIVWAYNASDTTDHWKKYDPSAPFGNDLANIEPGKGYWIMMTTDDILEI